MKIFKRIAASFAVVLTLGLAAGCSNTFEEVLDLMLDRCLQPLNLSAKVDNGQTVTFNWDVTKDAEKYNLEVYYDKGMTSLAFKDEIMPSEVPVTKYLDVDQTYYYRVQATSSSRKESKWAEYTSSIKTFAVKSNLYMEVGNRTADAVTLTWSADPEVDRIEYAETGAESYNVYTLTESDITSASATISGLVPSTEYDIILYFSSANRGQVDVWTLPNPDGLTKVSTNAALVQSIADGANILLTMDGSPYTIGAADIAKGLDVAKGFKIYGEGAVNGNRPVIIGSVNITDAFDGGDIYFEGVELNGNENTCGFLIQHKEGSTADGVVINSIIYKNCVITGYSKGLMYEWGKTVKIGEFTFDCCDIHAVNAEGTNGGDGFDIRQASEFGQINFVNNTIYNGFRTFFRLDANPVVGDVKFENNTFMNLSFVDNTNNAGIFGIQTVPASFSLKNNLFLNMVEKSVLESANTKYVAGENLNLAAAENYFYNCAEGFFTTNFTLAMAAGTILDSDPCYNAKGGLFNILSSSAIAGKKIGAAKWWSEYVEAPEDLTLELVDAPHTWNLNNATYFSSDFTKSKVRDRLLMGVENNKILCENGMLHFTAGATTTRKGVPTDGYLAFKVDKPGSVVLKASDEAGLGHHFVVGVGPLNGSTISVKGGVAAMTDMTTATKILIKDITEESLVYIYPTGEISLEKIAWSDDLKQVNTALETPVVAVSPASVDAGEATDVTVTWEDVDYAGSYSVVFNGNSAMVDEGNSYTIPGQTIGFLGAGAYKVEVYANPSKDDIYNTQSSAGTAAFAIVPKSSGEESEFIVKNTDELNAAIAAGKSEITLAAGEYNIGAATFTAPLALKGQDGAAVTGSITLSGAVGNFSLKNIAFTDAEKSASFITLADDLVAEEVTIENCDLVNYGKSLIYGPNAGASVDRVIVRGVTATGLGSGQGTFDFRKGTYGEISLLENTIVGGRDFIRADATCAIGTITIKNNTIDGATIGNGNGVLYVRASVLSYKVMNNLFLNEYAEGKTTILSKAAGIVVPSHMSANFFYNIDQEKFFSGLITDEIATANGGVVLTANPVKNAANGDYTLTSPLAMSSKVGASRWNPSFDAGSTDSFTVTSADEFTAALGAGKSDLKLAAGKYELGLINVPAGLRLKGEKGAEIVGALDIAGENLGNIVIEGIDFTCDGTNSNAINISAASTASKLIVRSCIFDGYGKSVFYDGTGLTADAIIFTDVVVKNQGTGQGVFDKRKGAVTIFTIEQSTVTGGRDLVRSDAGTITGAFNFVNNTIDGSNVGVNGNGIMYVRATDIEYIFKNNLFINEVAEGKSVLLSKAAGVNIPTIASNNFVYNVDEVNFFSGLFTEATAGAVKLSYDPCKNCSSGDYTLTDALALSSNIGAARWNPNAGKVTTDFTAASMDEFVAALSAGKSAITLKYGTYDFRTVADASFADGIFTATANLTLKGETKAGVGPEIIGCIKLGEGANELVVENIRFNGSEKSLGNCFEVAAALSAGKISVRNCEIFDYNKSLIYGNAEGDIRSASFDNLIVHDMGTGQGMFDFRKKIYGALSITNSTIYNGGRDFIRCDAGVGESIIIRNNTLSNTGIGAGNGLLWVRSNVGSQYVVENNLFLNETGSTILAKTGAVAPVFKNNWFFNLGESFWNGAFDKATATAGNGGEVEADPCTDSANGKFTLTNADLKAAKVGAPRWR